MESTPQAQGADLTQLRSDQGYSARGIVSRINKIGQLQRNLITLQPEYIYRWITFDAGGDHSNDFVATFVKPADKDAEGFVDMAALQEGDVLVQPGLVYRKISWNDTLYSIHRRALRKYARKDIMVAEKVEGPAIDVGTVDLRTER